jgi:hypothetical protein
MSSSAASTSRVHRHPPSETGRASIGPGLTSNKPAKEILGQSQAGAKAPETRPRTVTAVLVSGIEATHRVRNLCEDLINVSEPLRTELSRSLALHQQDADVWATVPSTKRLTRSWEQAMAALDALLLEIDLPIIDSHIQTASSKITTRASTELVAKRPYNQRPATTKHLRKQERNMVYGIRGLPDEVLTEIFARVVESEREDINENPLNFKSPFTSQDLSVIRSDFHFSPFNIAAVCQHWRAISVSAPKLWTYLKVPKPVLIGDTPSVVVGGRQFERALSLAGNQPLELTLYASGDHQISHAYLSSLPPNTTIARVNTIGVEELPWYLPLTPYLCAAFAPAAYGLPWLTATFLTCHAMLLTRTRHLVLLEALPLCYELVALETLHFKVTTPLTFPNLAPLFHCLPALRRLQIELPLLNGRDTASPFQHTALETIVVTSELIPKLAGAASEGLSFPNLKHLVLSNLFGPILVPEDIQSSLTDFLAPITDLEVQICSADGIRGKQTMGQLLQYMPALCRLSLGATAVTPSLQALITAPSPELSRLVLRDWDGDGALIVQFLASVRQVAGRKVPTIELYNCDRVLPSVREEINQGGGP